MKTVSANVNASDRASVLGICLWGKLSHVNIKHTKFFTDEDGAWSGWGMWSRCQSTCGPETKSRRRDCHYPDPNCKGERCPGVGREFASCKNPCCKWQLLDSLLMH